MLQPSRRAVRGIAVAALLTLSPALVGCGFSPQTNQQYQPAVGTNFRTSDVDVLGAVVVAAESGEGRVIASFVNNVQTQPDAVTGISGAGDDSAIEVDFPGEVEVPAGGLVNLADRDQIIATGDGLVPGALVNLRYTFANAEAVTFQAVVVAPLEAYANLAPGETQVDEIEIPPSSGGDPVIGEGGDGGTAPLESDESDESEN